MDETGSAYVTGVTASSEDTFPVTVGPDLSFNGGAYDAFVAKLDPSGTVLEYAGYIGGSVRIALGASRWTIPARPTSRASPSRRKRPFP